MENKPNENTKFWIHPDDFNKIISYAAASYNEFKAEIAGQMIVEQDEDGDYILKTPEILKQEVSGGECSLDAEELALYYSRNARKYGIDVRFCWWHSHHTMKAFWSGTDDETILSNKAKDWSVSLVVNLKKEYKLRIQFFEPFLHEVNVDLNFLSVDDDINESIIEEVKEKCTKSKPVVVNTYKHNYNDKNQGYLGFNGYNYKYDEYDAYSYPNHNANNGQIDEVFDTKGIPKDKLDKAQSQLEETLDEISFFTNEEEALSVYNQKADKINSKNKKYNFEVIKFNSAIELDRARLAYFTDDFFVNKKKGAKA